MKILFIITTVFLVCSTAFPLLESYHWLIRGFDFPRIQIFVFTLIYLFISLIYIEEWKYKVLLTLACIVSLGLDVYRVGRYTPAVEVESTMAQPKDTHFKVISMNLFINNKKYEKVINLVEDEDPDVFLALEPDKVWEKNLEPLNTKYAHRKLIPMDNTYGMFFYSKFPITKLEVMYLVDKKVPSLLVELEVKPNELVTLICVHPRPPRPGEASSLQRDGELMAVAKMVKKLKNKPVLVIGDLNDVAWSHTTRLFKRVSGTLDPRIGRGFYNTFPSNLKFFSFPLDHMFHNKNLELTSLEVLKDIGSDHLPITASFNISSGIKDKPEKADKEDVEDAKEISQEAEHWDGPEEEVKE